MVESTESKEGCGLVESAEWLGLDELTELNELKWWLELDSWHALAESDELAESNGGACVG